MTLPDCDCGTCCDACGHCDDCIRVTARDANTLEVDEDDTAPTAWVVLTAEADVLGREVERLAAQLAAHRDQVLTEAADLLLTTQAAEEAAELARHGFRDYETTLQRDAVHAAAKRLLAARTTTAQES